MTVQLAVYSALAVDASEQLGMFSQFDNQAEGVIQFNATQADSTFQHIFVSESQGDDAKTSEEASNPETPWKSLEKVSQNLQKGKYAIFIKKGDTLSGELLINSPNNLIEAVVITTYGEGNAPVLSGLSGSDNWISEHQNIWTTNTQSPYLRLFDGDDELPIVRHPIQGYYSVDSVLSQDQIMVNLLSENIDSGSTLNVHTVPWRIDRNIINHADGTQRIAKIIGKPSYQYFSGQKLFITNSKSLLRRQFDWAVDPIREKLLLYSERKPHSSVRFTKHLTGITLNRQSNVSIEGIHFHGYSRAGILIKMGKDVSVTRSSFKNIGFSGIVIENSESINIQDNQISDCGASAVHATMRNSRIINNELKKIALIPETHGIFWQFGAGKGLYILGSNNHISSNNLDSIGNDGIYFQGTNNIISKNIVSNFCLMLTDCGGIRSWSPSFDSGTSSGSLISRNIINGIHRPGNRLEIEGIYLDDRSNGITIFRNSIRGVRMGIYLHNTRGIRVHGNVLFQPSVAGFYLNENITYSGEMTGNIVSYNTVLTSASLATPIRLAQLISNSKIGVIDHNFYYSQSSNIPAYVVDYASPSRKAYYAQSEWISLGYDSSSTISTLGSPILTQKNPLAIHRSNVGPASWRPFQGIQHLSSDSLGNSLFVRLYEGSKTPRLSSPIFKMEPNTPYLLNLDVESSTIQQINITARKPRPDYAILSEVPQSIRIKKGIIHLPLKSLSNDEARIDITLVENQGSIRIHSASLHEMNAKECFLTNAVTNNKQDMATHLEDLPQPMSFQNFSAIYEPNISCTAMPKPFEKSGLFY